MFQTTELESYVQFLEDFERNVAIHRFFAEIGNINQPILKFFRSSEKRPDILEAIKILEAQLILFQSTGDIESGSAKQICPVTPNSKRDKQMEYTNNPMVSKQRYFKEKDIGRRRVSLQSVGALDAYRNSLLKKISSASKESSNESDSSDSELETKLKKFQFFESNQTTATRSISFRFS